MSSYVIRVWLPDRPGALGAVASRIGSVGGDVVGIDILERGAGRAIDELVVELPDIFTTAMAAGPTAGANAREGNGHEGNGHDERAEEDLVALMVAEMQQVDGVDVEEVRPAADSLRDPRLDALETAAVLVGASTPDDAIEALCSHAMRTIGGEWGVVVGLDPPEERTREGDAPDLAWVTAFVAGSQSSARVAGGSTGPEDVVWAPLPAAGLALVLGRTGTAFRARERRQAAALARIVDTRFRELSVNAARAAHPSTR